jgi:hypothetical protein
MGKKYKQEIDLSKLPRWEIGRHKDKINWKKSVGYKVHFIYDDIEGDLLIVNYTKTNEVEISYNCKSVIINTIRLTKCQIGQLLNKITSDFKVEIGTRFQDSKRDLTIIDKEYRQEENIDKQGRKSIANRKWYKYTCNVCGWTEGWIDENSLLGKKERGCTCCSGHSVVEGINDIPSVANWMVKYFQGGYDEAKLYTRWGYGNKYNRDGYIYPICPDCGRVKSKKMAIETIYRNHSISCSCSDKIPYPEKIMFNLLEQLGLDFQTQLSKAIFEWCEDYRYDFSFIINNEQHVIETHGLQHYKDCTGQWKTKLNNQLNIDENKRELALKNGIKYENYIIIDCRKSELDWIKNNILKNNKLNKLFDLSVIDWLKAEEFACSNLVKIASKYKRNNPDLTSIEIAKLMKLSKSPIQKYLKKGNDLKWCTYNADKEHDKSLFKKGQKSMNSKSVVILQNNIILYNYIFESCVDLERKSEKLFGYIPNAPFH